MLTIESLNAWYGAEPHPPRHRACTSNRGEIVCLVGRNGAGKTTTLRSVMGLAGRATGRVTFDGTELLGRPAHIRNGLGLGYVPEERRIVAGLSLCATTSAWVCSPQRCKRSEREVIEEIAEHLPPPRRAPGPDRTSPCPAANSRCSPSPVPPSAVPS